jgi:hypothetical protein
MEISARPSALTSGAVADGAEQPQPAAFQRLDCDIDPDDAGHARFRVPVYGAGEGEDILVHAQEVDVGSGDVWLSGFHGHTEPFRFHVAPIVGCYSPQQAIDAPTSIRRRCPGRSGPAPGSLAV